MSQRRAILGFAAKMVGNKGSESNELGRHDGPATGGKGLERIHLGTNGILSNGVVIRSPKWSKED